MHRVHRALALLIACVGCSGGNTDDEVFTDEDLALLRSMAHDPVATPPVDVSNDVLRLGALNQPATPAFRNKLVIFGQQLFFDTGLSTPRPDGVQVSCATCHMPGWFGDPREANNVSLGLGWSKRNSPSLVNVGYYVTFGWDGGADSLWAQGKHAFENDRTMKGDRLHLARQVARRYGDPFEELFQARLPPALLTDAGVGQSDLDLVYHLVLKAWSAYELQLVSGGSRFDLFARGDFTALDPAERNGLHLFIGKAGCISCHLGPHFTDNLYHSVGVRQDGDNVPEEDLGHYSGLQKLRDVSYNDFRLLPARSPTEDDEGRFRTKGLRQVAQSAPYFHAGQVSTLAEVVSFYNQGGQRGGAGQPSPLMVPLNLTVQEQADLVAFLGSLTGSPVPARYACDNSLQPTPNAPRCP